jgi:hypothetical protein
MTPDCGGHTKEASGGQAPKHFISAFRETTAI